MKLPLLALLLAACLIAAPSASIHVFGHTWLVPDAADWQVQKEGDAEVLHMAVARGPLPGPRRPIQFALSDMPPAREAAVEFDVRPLKRSVIIVFDYQDEAHFNYAHLSTDTATAQPVHNGIFHVFGGERVRISPQAGPAAFPAVNRWYHVKLVTNGSSGAVDVLVDGQPVPALHAVDLSLDRGKVGVGSFDETGDFKNLRVLGASPSPLSRLRF